MKRICAMARTPIGIDMGRRWTRHACDVVVLFLGRAVAGASPKGEGREGWKVAPNGCEIGPFLHASEILACGGSDCNGIEDLSNFGSRIWG
jgi:hypothetical protein